MVSSFQYLRACASGSLLSPARTDCPSRNLLSIQARGSSTNRTTLMKLIREHGNDFPATRSPISTLCSPRQQTIFPHPMGYPQPCSSSSGSRRPRFQDESCGRRTLKRRTTTDSHRLLPFPYWSRRVETDIAISYCISGPLAFDFRIGVHQSYSGTFKL